MATCVKKHHSPYCGCLVCTKEQDETCPECGEELGDNSREIGIGAARVCEDCWRLCDKCEKPRLILSMGWTDGKAICPECLSKKRKHT